MNLAEQTNAEIVRRFAAEGLGRADMKIFDALVDESVVVIAGLSYKEPIRGRAAYKQAFMASCTSDVIKNFELHEVLTTGDRVLVRFATRSVFRKDSDEGVMGASFDPSMHDLNIYTLKNGKIIEIVMDEENFPLGLPCAPRGLTH